jgi:tetratricopeptide (TPR) repeat protein
MWVLILDNVDDAGFLLEANSTGPDVQSNGSNSLNSGSARPLVSYLPQCQHGSILITTRSRSAALKLVEQRSIIAVEPMEEVHAIALFTTKLENLEKLGTELREEDITELAAVLEFMPLAIVQAAAYISERAPRCSVRQYLERFRKGDDKRTSLLDHEGGQLRRDHEAKNSIIITWQISFDHIRQTRPSAADLLSLMSFFDCQGIPEVLLQNRTKQSNNPRNREEHDGEADDTIDDFSSQSSQSDEFEKDIVALRNFSFISVNADGTTFEMHGLVQLATRKWLEAHGQLERWKQQFIRKLREEFPTGEYENWAVCQVLFPHAKLAAVQRPEGQDSLRDWASILHNAAWYAWRMGNGVEAEKMSVLAMRVRQTILGQEHEDTLQSMIIVGYAYTLRGRWEAAEELEVQVMETRKKKLGADHPDMLTSMANLASTFWSQGRWEAAEELQVQVMETSKKKLGADHPETLTSMDNLASTYRNQGRWEAAEELQVQVIETFKKKIGADHPDTLTSMNNLALTYEKQGRLEAAEELEVQVIETRKKKLGADHPDTLTSMNNLAVIWKKQGRDIEAVGLMKECVRLRQRILGADHPRFIGSSEWLARWVSEQRDDEALAESVEFD